MSTRAKPRRFYGVRWFVGCPQSGKSTLARELASRLHRERRVPVIVLDAQSVHNFAELPECKLEDVAATVWKHPRASVRVVPRDVDEVDRICRAVSAGGDVVLLVDEAHNWLSAQSGCSGELVRLMRTVQHARADLFLTTQHLTGDVHQGALSCTSELYVFRNTSPRVLQVLERDFGMDRAKIQALPQFKCFRKLLGFQG